MGVSRFPTRLTMTAGVGLIALLTQSPVHAQTFDFEELAVSSGATPIISTQGGVTATITRLDGGNIVVQDLTGAAAPWGSRTLLPFVDGVGSTMIINFSVPLTSISIQAGDNGNDDDGLITLTAFSGSSGAGSNLGSDSQAYPDTLNAVIDGEFLVLGVTSPGIQSVTLTSGGPLPNSIFYDNMTVQAEVQAAAPEPASAALLLPFLGIAAVYRRPRK
jgi:hypothetical protein